MLSYRFHISREFHTMWMPNPVMPVGTVRDLVLRETHIVLDNHSYLELREAESGRVLDDDTALLRVTTPIILRRRARLEPTQKTLEVEATRAPQKHLGRATR